MSKPIMAGKLTKKFFMNMAEGQYLVSNIGYTPVRPILAESVVEFNLREFQWKRIVEVGANHRLCYVFKSQGEYTRHFCKLFVESIMN
jgi:hypothetical protein